MNNISAMQQPAAITTTSLSASSMLVELSISTWQGRRLDKSASKEVTQQNGAKLGVANVNKKLLGDCKELDTVLAFAKNARTIHYSCTMPWSDSGMRLLPTAAYFKYHEQMTALQAEFFRLVEKFIAAYDWEVIEAQVRLGDLFHRDEYPTSESLRHRFAFNINYIPLPTAGDWRVDVGNEGNAQLREHYEKFFSTQLHEAMNDVWKRAYTALERMSERLDYETEADKKLFRDSLVTNVIDIVELLDVCNVTNDPVMEDARVRLQRALQGVDADDLRKNAPLRRATKQTVDEVIASLPGLGM